MFVNAVIETILSLVKRKLAKPAPERKSLAEIIAENENLEDDK